jgi:hypothetical protein
LVKNNVPFDVAMSIPDEESLAYAVILGTFEGGKFSWDRMRWEDQK